jgi:hypothetical protein
MNLFLVKTKLIGDGQLDREVFVVVVHGRYYNRSGGFGHGFFGKLVRLIIWPIQESILAHPILCFSTGNS